MEVLLGKTLAELQDVAQQVGLPRFAGKQLAQWLYQKRAVDFEQMTNISLRGRECLKANYVIGRYEPKAQAVSVDGTKKYLFDVGNDKTNAKTNFVESVFIPEEDRATICVSTQAGCKMGCRFCMTGTLGFHGQLSAAQILNQIFSIPDSEKLTNIVYMGEGEPCDNIDAVLRSIEVLTSDWGLAWSPKRITVSSVGVIEGLKRLLDETQCHVAISLHNPLSVERAEMMPAQRKWDIERVIDLLKQYDWSGQRRVSFEYICFGGQNDTLRHAAQLKRLLKGLQCRVNFIRYHNIDADSAFAESDEKQMIWFRDYLTENGITTTIRRSRGEDILAACGMLVNSLNEKKSK